MSDQVACQRALNDLCALIDKDISVSDDASTRTRKVLVWLTPQPGKDVKEKLLFFDEVRVRWSRCYVMSWLCHVLVKCDVKVL